MRGYTQVDLMNDPKWDYRIYDVYFTGTVFANRYQPDMSVIIENSDAEWIWCGSTTTGDQSIKILPKNALGRAIANVAFWRDSWGGSLGLSAPLGSYWYPLFPRDSVIRFDLQNVSAGDITCELLFWGFKRFRKGEAPC